MRNTLLPAHSMMGMLMMSAAMLPTMSMGGTSAIGRRSNIIVGAVRGNQDRTRATVIFGFENMKPLIIIGPVTERQLNLMISELAPGGLWLDVEMVGEDKGLDAVWEWSHAEREK